MTVAAATDRARRQRQRADDRADPARGVHQRRFHTAQSDAPVGAAEASVPGRAMAPGHSEEQRL